MREHQAVEASFPSRGLTRAVLVLGALGALGTAACFVVEFGNDIGAYVWLTPFLGTYAGGVVAIRLQPQHVASRRLLVFGTLATLWIGSSVALVVAFESQGERWWLGLSNVVVQFLGLGMEAALVALLAVYPDGRYHHSRERHVVTIAATLALTLPLLLLVFRESLAPSWAFAWGAETDTSSTFPTIDSPVNVDLLSFLAVPVGALIEGALVLGPLVGSVLVALRYRRLPRDEETRVRWPMYGVLLLLLIPLAALLHEYGGLPLLAFDGVIVFALLALPASILIGLVKPDLFDIDRAMRRSFVYVPLWLAIAGAYLGIVAALGVASSALGLQVTVALTIVATLLVDPVRRKLARRAASWAKGASLNGEEMVRWLGETLQDTLDQRELAAKLAEAATRGLGIRWATIALDGLEPVTYGTRDGRPAITSELVHSGKHLGQIECGPRTHGHHQATDVETLAALARQASLTIHNARLAEELRASLHAVQTQAAELSASRSRIVAAEAAARRQIERDIHDGAQQDLIALIARIGLARNELGADAAPLAPVLDELQVEVRDTLTNLRRLASGIHPTELSDHGLIEAIEGRSARMPLPVIIACPPDLRKARFDEQTEGAAYFFVSEALTNTLKHARAGAVRIAVERVADQLEIRVSDDGIGFDCPDGAGTGLSGLKDRMESLGGSVSIVTAPGQGTTLSACLPVGGPHDR